MAEIYCEDKRPLTKIRRLHLIVVDLEKTRSVSKRVYHEFQDVQLSADLDGCLIIHYLSPSPSGNVLIGFDLSLPTGLMILTGQVTCFGHAEGTVGTSGWLIRGLAGFLIRLQLASLHPLGWNISSMRLP